ncbi:MAG: Obg family GTPase, partial [Planctomycetota bacterium]
MFVDEAEIRVRAGKGGDGAVAFLREKYRPKGGPAGGDGGRGGSVYLVATTGESTLLEVARKSPYRARHGQPGGNKHCTGKSAEDLEIPVPLGTLVFELTDPEPVPELEEGEEEAEAPAPAPRFDPEDGVADLAAFLDPEDLEQLEGMEDPLPRGKEGERLLCDLTEDGQRFRVCRGGRAGRGNARFASSTNQVPRESTPGAPGEYRRLRLELKILADVGLVGLPSAGKSTLISRVSAARPKIAAYPFTTLSPVPGIVRLSTSRTCVIADLPGLIKDAHRGVGLGIQFLRHIERTRMIVHVVDVAPLSGKDPIEAYHEIREELTSYGADLDTLPELIALNKMDLPAGRETLKAFREAIPDRPIYPISAVTGHGLRTL